ncbi:MAG: CPBP family intramembrane glutamic endopeptidase [Promethearchaeota archaeon]|jgi:membrane protease YdiL (CAAX protease family)
MIKKYPLIVYFIIAYVSTWLLALPLILNQFGFISVNPNWHFWAALGPTISAIIVTYISEKKEGIKKLRETSFKWRVGAFWIAFSILIVPFFLLLTIVLNWLFTGNVINLIAYLINNGITDPVSIIIWIWVGAISYGIFEEIGWRGYALPKLQEKYNPLIATIILTILWAFWHVPLFFYRLSIQYVFGWFFGLFMGAIVLTFLFNSTGKSAFVAILFHITNNIVWLFNIAEVQMYVTIMLVVLVLIILIIGRTQLTTKKSF